MPASPRVPASLPPNGIIPRRLTHQVGAIFSVPSVTLVARVTNVVLAAAISDLVNPGADAGFGQSKQKDGSQLIILISERNL